MTPHPRRTQQLLWLVAAGLFLQTLDTTIVNTALPAMARSLAESPLRMQSVVVSFTLTMALVIPASGWLTDRFGLRRVYTASILLFVLGSIGCAAAHGLGSLVLARVVQALGGALLLPVGRLAVLQAVPANRFLDAMGFVAVPALIGPLIGPTLGGWLAEYLSWHWIFLINIPVGLVGAWLTWNWMPEAPAPERRPFDRVGYLLLAGAMVGMLVGVDGLAEFHAPPWVAGLILLVALGLLLAYRRHASRHHAPLFTPSLWHQGRFRTGMIGNLAARLGNSGIPFLLPLTLQVGLGYSPAQAGAMLIPSALGAIGAKRLVAPYIRRRGYRDMLVTNTVLLGVCIATLASLGHGQPLWVTLTLIALFGAVNSMQFTAMNTLALRDLDQAHASAGNSLLSMGQMLAMSLAVALAGAVLTSFTTYRALLAPQADPLWPFRATFICLGVLTAIAALVFSRLPPMPTPPAR